MLSNLKVSDGLAECLPLSHIVPGLLKHELTAGDGHVCNQQAFLEEQEVKSINNDVVCSY